MKFETVKVTLEELVKLRKDWLINHNKNINTVSATPYDDYFFGNEFPIIVNKESFEMHSYN